MCGGCGRMVAEDIVSSVSSTWPVEDTGGQPALSGHILMSEVHRGPGGHEQRLASASRPLPLCSWRSRPFAGRITGGAAWGRCTCGIKAPPHSGEVTRVASGSEKSTLRCSSSAPALSVSCCWEAAAATVRAGADQPGGGGGDDKSRC